MRTRIGALALTVIAAGGAWATPAVAAPPTKCQVENLGTQVSYSDLQVAIDAAASGAVIQVKGVCQGNYSVIDKELTLKGKGTKRVPQATLDGGHAGTVLYVRGRGVTLSNLTVTNGSAGGIDVFIGSLTLTGTTLVTANAGGGVSCNTRSAVTLGGASRIEGNTTPGSGGGIAASDCFVTLTGTSTVTRNTATLDGGGIWNNGQRGVSLQDSAQVSSNTAGGNGGGIAKLSGQVGLSAGAVVTANRAGGLGGGVYADGVWSHVVGGLVTKNLPDDIFERVLS